MPRTVTDTSPPRCAEVATVLANVQRPVFVALPSPGYLAAVGSALADSPFKEQGEPGLRFYTRLKTAAVRFAW